jgi:SH3-like domain-containing protein
MKPIIRLFTAIMILTLGALACNLPSKTATPQPADLSSAMTLAVQTIQAATQASPTSVPANTAPPAATPSTPMVTVSSATNCRTGPDTSYALVLVFQPGATAEVVGKYTPSNYWIIQTPTGGTCWLWGAYATVQGNVAALAEMAPPTPSSVAIAPTTVPTSGSGSGSSPSPTPTTKPLVLKPILINPGIIKAILMPSAPSSLTVTTTCTYFPFVRTDHLSWPAVSNATGYYVYENGSKISGTTGTSINLIGATTTGSVSFGVVAYNSNGTSGTTSASVHCP